MDRLGRKICPSVLDAAEEIGIRAIEHAENEFIDPAVAATLLEAAATDSRAPQEKTQCTQNVVRPSVVSLLCFHPARKQDQVIYEDVGRVRSIRSHNSCTCGT
ncbi:MAG: hypothetical protein DMG56_18775 [Acidobacteria bacterium]|nr:MAG: hypothetical protein DMG54_08835 [Acidobacteriota bacterium]PYU44585.1 MAG: hypothetical protein DMG53_16225 [Acidobacteriota bacterium]PYU59265.1 MAG: hypothetical protein DMG56_18775 [Acidobacteriota bacterium]PYU72201.1 MAG: hypothetical protein DMG52_19225 [Acidobacteriota bacterium]